MGLAAQIVGRRARRSLAALGFAGAVTRSLAGCPDPSSSVCGTVSSCAGPSPLEGVRVTYSDGRKSVASDSKADGTYCLPLAPADEGYELRFEKAGYETSTTAIGPQDHGLAAADKVPSVCLDVVAAVDGGVPEADAADDGG